MGSRGMVIAYKLLYNKEVQSNWGGRAHAGARCAGRRYESGAAVCSRSDEMMKEGRPPQLRLHHGEQSRLMSVCGGSHRRLEVPPPPVAPAPAPPLDVPAPFLPAPAPALPLPPANLA